MIRNVMAWEINTTAKFLLRPHEQREQARKESAWGIATPTTNFFAQSERDIPEQSHCGEWFWLDHRESDPASIDEGEIV
jgi:hypothetical protein